MTNESPKMVRVDFFIDEELLRDIEAWRGSKNPIPSRAAIVRLVLREGINALRAKDEERKRE